MTDHLSPLAVQAVPRAATKPLGGRAQLTSIFLALTMVGTALSVWAEFDALSLIGDIQDGARVSLADADAADDRISATSMIQFVGYVPAAIAFLLWYLRAYAYVPHQRYSRSWIGWYWVIPFVSFFAPKMVVNDIDRAGDPRAAELDHEAFGRLPVTLVVHLWWAAWIGSLLADRIVFRGDYNNAASLDGARSTLHGYLVSDGLILLSAGLAIVVVRHLTAQLAAVRGTPAAP